MTLLRDFFYALYLVVCHLWQYRFTRKHKCAMCQRGVKEGVNYCQGCDDAIESMCHRYAQQFTGLERQ